MTGPPISVSPFHWSRLIKKGDVRKKFEHLLGQTEEVVRNGRCLKKVSNLTDVSHKVTWDGSYYYQRFVMYHKLLVPTGIPGEFYVFEDQQEAGRFKRLLAAEESHKGKTEKMGPVPDAVDTPKIIGESTQIKRVLRLTRLVAKSAATVLIIGESGTGKELFAKTIHYLSPRREKPFVAINCSAIPEPLIESELFGHEKGAFTDAKFAKLGRFELAHGGTLFLDEVGELPLLVQVKVLRFLQERTFERVGGTETLKADVRIVATTNSDLTKALNEKRFREDLYYRLNVFPITLPPLRERLEDVPLLQDFFLAKFCASMSIKIPTVTSEVELAIINHPWPGNVRELENLVERALIHSQGRVVLSLEDFTLGNTVPCLGVNISYNERVAESLASLKDFENLGITAALKKTGGSKSKAAEVLGIDVKTLRRKIKEYNITVAR